MRRLLVSVAVLFLLPALTAPKAAHVRGIIMPPAGWSRESLQSRNAALGTVLAQWLSFDRGDEEYIEIGRRPSYGFNQQSFVAFYRAHLQRDEAHILASRPVGLCNGEHGWYVKSRAAVPFGGYTREDVIFVDGSHVYFASYSYPGSLRPLATAERAIASLCIPHPAIVKPLVLPVAFSAPRGWLASNPRETGGPVWPGTIALFLNASNPNEVLMLSREAVDETPSPDERAQTQQVEAMMKRENVHVKVLTPETHSLKRLCADHFGFLFHYAVAYGRQHVIYEQMTMIGSPLYSAIYIRPSGTKPDPDAMAALATLCPLTPALPPTPTPVPSPLSTQVYEITPAAEPTSTP